MTIKPCFERSDKSCCRVLGADSWKTVIRKSVIANRKTERQKSEPASGTLQSAISRSASVFRLSALQLIEFLFSNTEVAKER
ncbi:MAG: hypothetical protein D6719_03340 [Candidatus Dadabacteria bacterium]|nr:MAG: hypothetical protein D6719_03340 [Candidatus Dadabacteria bacterium]